MALLSGGSLAVALVLGAAGVSLTPGAARAANECGVQSGTTALICTGSHGSITYSATSANLTLNLRAPVSVTGGILVTPTGTNSVTIGRTTDVTAGAGDPQIANSAGAAINVERATAGTITINLTDNDADDAPLLSVTGTTAGIRVRNGTGTSSSSVTTTNGAITATAGAGVDLGTSGTGGLTFTNGATVTGSTAAVLVASGVNASVTNNATGVLLGAVVMNNTGTATVTNHGSLFGAVTMNNAGTATVTNNGAWRATGSSFLGAGATTLTNSATGMLFGGYDGGSAVIDFGTGVNNISNIGRVVVGGGVEGASTLQLQNVTTWTNIGLVLFGVNGAGNGSDGAANDRLVADGVFNGASDGSNASRLVMDVDFTGSQADCTAAVAADCFDLRGGATAGTTSVLVNALNLSDDPGGPFVLIDVAGGTGDGTFTVDPLSTAFRDAPDVGGVIDAGLFVYGLGYDRDAQQYVLEARPDTELFELSLLSRVASEPWRTANGFWHDRREHLRAGADTAGYGPAVWLGAGRSLVDRTRRDDIVFGANALNFNNGFEQETTAIVGGVDVIRSIDGDRAWLVGLTAGKIDSSAQFTRRASAIELDGRSYGAYASFASAGLFVDGIVSVADLDLAYNGVTRTLETDARSVGFEAEAAWRVARLNEDGPWLEPLVALSYVTTDIDDVDFTAATSLSFDDPVSLRGGLGARLGGTFDLAALTTSVSVTGRVWKDFKGDYASTLSSSLVDMEFADDAMETLGDFGLALNLSTPGGNVSANLAYNLLFNDNYHNDAATLGVRLRW